MVGKIVAHIMANTSGFSAGTKRAGRSLQTLDKSFAGSAKSAAKWGAGIAAAAGAAFATLVRQSMQAVDAQAKLARSVDGTIGGLEGLERAAKDAGVAAGTASQAAQRLNVALAQAREGSGAAAEALDRIGVSAGELLRVDVDERFAVLADRMREAGMTTDQMALALRDLGTRNREMVLLMQQGGDAIRDATAEMAGYGLAVDAIDAAMIENLNDQLDRANDVWRGITTQLAVHAAPAIQAVVGLFSDASRETDGFSHQSERLVRGLVRGAGYAADAIHGLRMAFEAVKAAAQGMLTVVYRISESLIDVFVDMTQAKVDTLNRIIRGMNRISPVNLAEIIFDRERSRKEMAWFMGEAVRDSERMTDDILNNLHRLANDMPSDRLNAAYQAALQDRERLAAEHEQNERRRLNNLMQAERDAEMERARQRAALAAEREAREQEQEQRRLERMLAGLESHLRTEEEAIVHSYQRRFDEIEELREKDLLSEQQYLDAHVRAWEIAEEDIRAMRERGAQADIELERTKMSAIAAIVTGGMGRIAGSMDQQNKKIFQARKGLGIAEALISAYVGINAALAKGAAGIPEAITIGTAAMANVAAIARQQYSSSGGGGGGGSAASAVPQAAAAGPSPSAGTLAVTGIDPGTLFSGDVVSDLVERISEHAGRGGRVVMT